MIATTPTTTTAVAAAATTSAVCMLLCYSPPQTVPETVKTFASNFLGFDPILSYIYPTILDYYISHVYSQLVYADIRMVNIGNVLFKYE